MKSKIKKIFKFIVVIDIIIVSLLMIYDIYLELNRPKLKDDYYGHMNYSSLFIDTDVAKKENRRNKLAYTSHDYAYEKYLNDNIKNLELNLKNDTERDKQGFEPIKKYLNKIDSSNTMKELLNNLYDIHSETGSLSILSETIMPSYTKKNTPTLRIDGMSIRCYQYNHNDESDTNKTVINYYTHILKDIGSSDDEINNLKNYFELEKATCTNIEPEIYTPLSLNEMKAIYTNIDLNNYFRDYNGIDTFMLLTIEDEKKYNSLFIDENLNLMKAYFKALIVDYYIGDINIEHTRPHLPTKNFLLYDNFYLYLTNVNKLNTEIIIANQEIKDNKKNIMYIENIFNEIKKEYRNTISNCKWLSDESKTHLIKKLDNIKLSMNIPEEYTDILNSVEFKTYEEGSNLVENKNNFYRVYRDKQLEYAFNKNTYLYNINETIMMYATNPNAYYDYDNNTITLSYYWAHLIDSKDNYYKVMGELGTMFSHEMTHAFDSKFIDLNEDNLDISMLTEEEQNTYMTIIQDTNLYYSRYKFNGEYLNSELFTQENIADIGSMEVMMNFLSKKNPSTTDYKYFFKSFAQKNNTEGLENDSQHSPGQIRVNAIMSSTDKFYEIYNINKYNKMYVPKNLRLALWNKEI